VRLLPDTHALLWWLLDSPRLSARARELLDDDANLLLFSAATEWETRVKTASGKLPDIGDWDLIEETGVDLLPITHRHAAAAAALPPHHRDPFDRMLIAQAQLEDATILTADPAFGAYDVRVAW
jgi:PIN domain nuclease of toxin-antitoxin system